MSAVPEVVFNTATDPDRVGAWLPAPLREGAARRPDLATDAMLARWNSRTAPAWSARLEVRPIAAGGATVRLDLEADPLEQRLTEIADESLANLARAVDDNFTTG
jgi:hypothetical protein